MTSPGKNKRDNKISILNMKPNSEYVLTEIKSEETQIIENDKEPRNHRVELFINNEYKGVYSLKYLLK